MLLMPLESVDANMWDAIILVVLICIFCYLWIYIKYNYWSNRNVAHLRPWPLFGNYASFVLQRETIHEATHKLCKMFPDEPLFGSYLGTEPVLIVQDPDLVKLVLTKDFYYFNSREISAHTDREELTRNLFFTYGDNWKVMRQNLSPLFSSAKMKNMFYLVEKCSRTFEQLLDKEVEKSEVVDMRSLFARFTMEVICSCVFGIEGDVMTCKDIDKNVFRKIADEIMDTSSSRAFKTVLRSVYPSLFYGFGQKLFPDTISEFFDGVVKNVISSRGNTPSARQDFVDHLLQWKERHFIEGDSIERVKLGDKKKITKNVDDKLLVAQSVLFFAAGFETTSVTSMFTLLELSLNKDCQRRAQACVDEYLKDRHHLDYEVTSQVPYLEQCVEEALRLYPVLGVLTRECMTPTSLPGGVQVPRRMRLHVPVYTIQRDPRHFPQPELYNPERFAPENKHKIQPYTYIPFGEGPRVCIGMRFGKMLMLSGLVTVLKKYDVSLVSGGGRPRLEPRAAVSQPDAPVFFKLTPRAGTQQPLYTQ